MKNVLLTLIALSFSAVAASALEPLILEPLGGYARPTAPAYSSTQYNTGVANAATKETPVNVTTPKYPSNMIPQNDAAEGKPVTRKTPSRRIIIETKQGTRTNTQWNPGGKGTKSYF